MISFSIRSRVVTGMMPLLALSGCITDDGVPTLPRDRAGVFAALVPTPAAVTVAVGATQALTIHATDLQDAPIAPADLSITYLSSDPSTVRVDSQGVITGLVPSFTTKSVTITAVAGGVTKTATTFVTVSATPSVMASLSAQIVAPDSAWLGAQGVGASQTKALRPRALTAGGGTIPNVTFFFQSLTPNIATVTANGGVVSGVVPGVAQIAVTATVFGVTASDTVALTITPPVAATITFGLAYTLDVPSIRVQRNATITWRNSSGNAGIPPVPFDVTFDSLSANVGVAPSVGDVPAFTTGSQSRKFTIPGTYTYRSTNHPGVEGRVIVQ